MLAVEPIQLADLDVALSHLLVPPGESPAVREAAIYDFRAYLERCPVEWRGWRSGPPERPSGLFLAVVLPGSTGIVLVASPGEASIDAAAQAAAGRVGLASLAQQGLHYAQALVEPSAEQRIDALHVLGFRHMAPLAYLERDVLYPWCDEPDEDAYEWIAYTPEHAPRFAETVAATYVDSQDCPELTTLRSVEDALAAHRAGGEFDAALWELVFVDGAPAGCLLLNKGLHTPSLEIAYMGVVTGHRRQGVGQALLRRAIQRARQRRAKRLTVVVDERNGPAQHLYESFHFERIGRRDAYLRAFT